MMVGIFCTRCQDDTRPSLYVAQKVICGSGQRAQRMQERLLKTQQIFRIRVESKILGFLTAPRPTTHDQTPPQILLNERSVAGGLHSKTPADIGLRLVCDERPVGLPVLRSRLYWGGVVVRTGPAIDVISCCFFLSHCRIDCPR